MELAAGVAERSRVAVGVTVEVGASVGVNVEG